MQLGVLLLLLFTTHISAAYSSTPLRAVPVTEETIPPGATVSVYKPCGSLDLSNFTNTIRNESEECSLETSYRWAGTSFPTTEERQELCECKRLIQKLQQVTIPRCLLERDDRKVSYAQLVEYAFGLCSPNGGTAASPNTPTPPEPTVASSTTPRPENKAAVSDTATSAPSRSSSRVIVAIVGGLAVVVAIASFVAFKCRPRRHAESKREPRNPDDRDGGNVLPLSPVVSYTAMSNEGPSVIDQIKPLPAYATPSANESSSSGADNQTRYSVESKRTTRSTDTVIWEDPVLLAVRVPLDTVFFGPLLSLGGYGEVYKGTYRAETVAIKQLLPERRKDLTQIDAFLHEVKLMSALEHERIVKFIGVAWNALSDACAIVEYMENGDLRSVLTNGTKTSVVHKASMWTSSRSLSMSHTH